MLISRAPETVGVKKQLINDAKLRLIPAAKGGGSCRCFDRPVQKLARFYTFVLSTP